MTQATYLWDAPPDQSVPVKGETRRYPINRLFFVGRNYHAHAIEMARPVDKLVDRPFYFTKAPRTLVSSGATVPYPPETKDYQFEMELVVAIGKPGFRVTAADAHTLIHGCACGMDMARRDLQLAARDKGRPWDLGKDIENGSMVSSIVPMPEKVITSSVATRSARPRRPRLSSAAPNACGATRAFVLRPSRKPFRQRLCWPTVGSTPIVR